MGCHVCVASAWCCPTAPLEACAAENRVTIAASGAIRPLVTLLGSPSADVQEQSAGALWGLVYNGAWQIT